MLMATIICNPYGFHVIDLLPDDAEFNTAYFLGKMVAPFQSGIFPAGRTKTKRKKLFHLDDRPIHRSKGSQELFERNPTKKVP
jgi:hypothetical protein